MNVSSDSPRRATLGPVVLSLVLLVILLLLPTGFKGAMAYRNADRVDALVLATDESDLVDTGLIRSGEQRCKVRILSGQFAGTETTVVNRLNGSLAVDICSAVYEVVQKKPDITPKEAIHSGFAVGRAACGSTTTTLLLAYSGSFLTLLMVFMAQGTPVLLMLNYKYIAAEIVHTIVGSFGLVTVAPLTAITSGLLLTAPGASGR